MASKLEFTARPREVIGKASRILAREGLVPAVLYGPDRESKSLSIDAHEFERLMHHASVGSTLLDLHVEGEKDAIPVIIKEVRHHHTKGFATHVDFWAVRMSQVIQTVVAVSFVGTAAGELEGGIVMHAIRELHIEARPKDLPEAVVVDVSSLAIGDSVTVASLVPPAGVTFLDDPETVMASVITPALEVEEEKVAEEGVEVPEIGQETADEESEST
jgi:large subunit ribosomal protein L25